MKSCRDCHMLPGCGWCDDGSGTGLGKCLQGGKDGPFLKSGNSTAGCSEPNWNFIECPGNYLVTIVSQSLACLRATRGAQSFGLKASVVML